MTDLVSSFKTPSESVHEINQNECRRPAHSHLTVDYDGGAGGGGGGGEGGEAGGGGGGENGEG